MKKNDFLVLMEYKRNVDLFATLMLMRLMSQREKYGDSWKIVTIPQLRERIKEEYKEWLKAKTLEEELTELIDIANQCQLLFTRLLRGDE